MRTSTYKKKIFDLLNKNHLMSIADIHKQVKDANYSTIYRNIEQLVAEEKIRKITFDKGNVMYEVTSDQHHDHFLCTDCGEIEVINVPKVSSLLAKNYKISDLLVRGLCKECNQNT